MTIDESRPILNFFRTTPHDMLGQPPLASSLQSFETCLFLIGLHRFPSALISCATAWKSAIKSKLRIQENRRGIKLEKMLNDIRLSYQVLRDYNYDKLDEFRRTRNRITHFGFSPKDDDKCAALLLETGFPFLELCYREFFDFYLDWREIVPATKDFSDLSPEQMDKAGLVPDVAQQVHFVKDIYQHARQFENPNYSTCCAPLAHFIRWHLKTSARTASEWEMLDKDTGGTKSEFERKAKSDLESLLNPNWFFDCPICGGFESLVVELDFHSHDVVTDRCACVECGFVVGKGAQYVSQVVLADQLAEKRATILKEFGMEPA